MVQDASGTRVDLLLADMGFDEVAIGRAVEVEVHVDAENVAMRQGKRLDRDYVNYWLRQFELALDDSTLVESFSRMDS